MREDSPKDLLVELYNFNNENRLDFYALVRVILEHSQCAIISKPYWQVIDGNPGSEVFTIIPELECSSCYERYKHIENFTVHVIQCSTRRGVSSSQAQTDLKMHLKYGVVPKSVKAIIEDACNQRDLDAVCIAPVLDHPDIKSLADLQRKERERKLAVINTDEQTRGPTGPIIKLAKGAEMPLDRMVWIQTPLISELATLLLAGMQPIRHTSRGIHLPIMRDTGINKVIHLHVDQFEELAAIRMAEQNWENMKIELRHIGVYDQFDRSVELCIPDVMTGEPRKSFHSIGSSLNFKRPHDLISGTKLTSKMVDNINTDRRKLENAKRAEREAIEKSSMAAIEREKKAARLTTSANSIDGNMKVNGNFMPPQRFDETVDERPGCSKYI